MPEHIVAEKGQSMRDATKEAMRSTMASYEPGKILEGKKGKKSAIIGYKRDGTLLTADISKKPDGIYEQTNRNELKLRTAFVRERFPTWPSTSPTDTGEKLPPEQHTFSVGQVLYGKDKSYKIYTGKIEAGGNTIYTFDDIGADGTAISSQMDESDFMGRYLEKDIQAANLEQAEAMPGAEINWGGADNFYKAARRTGESIKPALKRVDRVKEILGVENISKEGVRMPRSSGSVEASIDKLAGREAKALRTTGLMGRTSERGIQRARGILDKRIKSLVNEGDIAEAYKLLDSLQQSRAAVSPEKTLDEYNALSHEDKEAAREKLASILQVEAKRAVAIKTAEIMEQRINRKFSSENIERIYQEASKKEKLAISLAVGATTLGVSALISVTGGLAAAPVAIVAPRLLGLYKGYNMRRVVGGNQGSAGIAQVRERIAELAGFDNGIDTTSRSEVNARAEVLGTRMDELRHRRQSASRKALRRATLMAALGAGAGYLLNNTDLLHWHHGDAHPRITSHEATSGSPGTDVIDHSHLTTPATPTTSPGIGVIDNSHPTPTTSVGEGVIDRSHPS